jgi:putative ABC transport system permease protein
MPDWGHLLRERLAPLALEPARQEEIIEELGQHLDDAWREGMSRGLTAADAERAVLAPLRDERALLEALRGLERSERAALAVGAPVPRRPLVALAQDVRFGLRLLRRRPGFALATVLTLALGIGANTAIFSVIDAVLLRPLPYPEPRQLVTYWGTAPEKGLPVVDMPPGLFDYHRRTVTMLESLAAYEVGGQNLSGGGEAERISAGYVTAGFFHTLGVAPRLGREFLPGEEHANGGLVAILSDGLWRRRFGADAAIIGRTIHMNELAGTVVGVMPPGFDFPGHTQVWIPERIDP